jgi:hypothetical protein
MIQLFGRLFGLLATIPFAARLLAAQTSLTIYSDGRVLERRMLELAIPAGRSVQRVALGPLDPSSLFALDSGVVLTGSSYDGAQDEPNAIRRAVGQKLTFLIRPATDSARTIEALVLGSDPERYQLASGRVVFERPGIPLFPADLVLARPLLALTVESDRARRSLGLGYLSSGASWRASYQVVLARNGARVTGSATVQAGTLRADSASVQLVAGNVGRPGRTENVELKSMRVASMAPAVAGEESIGETHLYALPGRMTLLPGVETSALLFLPVTTGAERTFTLRGQLPFWGGVPQGADEIEQPVEVTYVIKHSAKTEFGDRPVPGGTARIYQRDTEGGLQLIGEAGVGHTAAGQDLRLAAGTAFDLTARRTQTEFTTERTKDRTTATIGYSVTIANAKDSAVTVEVLEQRGGEWSVLSSSVSADRVSSTVTRFRVRVSPKAESTLTYRVRVVW